MSETNFSISFLLTGSEITEGRICDTNSQWMAEILAERGYYVSHILSVDDTEQGIAEATQFLLEKSEVVIVSGGIGPTEDDLTREVLAKVAGVPLEEDSAALQTLEALYKKRQRTMSPSNRKQASFPKGAKIVTNPLGTAPGFRMNISGRNLFSLPGVPWELKRMFQDSVVPAIEQLHSPLKSGTALTQRVLRIFGLSESVVGERVRSSGIPPGVRIAYRAAFPEVQVLLRGSTPSELDLAEEKCLHVLGGEYVFSKDRGCDLAQTTHQLLVSSGLRLALAESCTGGRVATELTAHPGSSQYFLGAAVTYSNELKQTLLGISCELLAEHGAVSEACACAMADGARKNLASDLAVSVTGIAGPEGGSEEKPVGLFFVGLSTPTKTTAKRYFMPLERPRIQEYACSVALDTIRRQVLGLPAAEYFGTQVKK